MRNVTFSGMLPKVDGQSLPTNNAILAENCLLHGGLIRPIQSPEPIREVVGTDGRKIDKVVSTRVLDTMVVGFDRYTPTAVDILKRGGPDSFLFVQDGKLYRSSTKWILDHQGPVPLGVCRPSAPPAVAIAGTCAPVLDVTAPSCVDENIGEGDCDETDQYFVSFLYTYVTPCQEESAPSGLSEPMMIPMDRGVFLSNPVNVPDNVAEIRWYMLLTSDGSSNPFYIGSTTPQQLGMQYCHRSSEFAEILQSQIYHHPEPCLEGVAVLGDTLTVVWHTNEIWLSEPRQPHAYPEQYRLTLDPGIQIKRIVTMQNKAEGSPYWYAIVLTNSTPYLLQGELPEQVQVTRVAREAPCLNPAGICVYEDKLFFASIDGILAMQGSSIINVTAPYCDTVTYSHYQPRHLSLGVYDKRLIALHPKHSGFMLNLNEQDSPYENDFVRLTTQAVTAEIHKTDLYIVGQNGIAYLWEKGATPLVAFWRSKDYTQSGLWHGTAAKVVSPAMRDVTGDEGREYLAKFLGDKNCRGHEDLARFLIKNPEAVKHFNVLASRTVEFFVFCDGVYHYSRHTSTNRSFRIKRNNRRMAWGYAVRTQVPIREIHIQTSKDDLTQEGGHA